MVKNTTGGKGHKQRKNKSPNQNQSRRLVLIDDKQTYAIVRKKPGGKRLLVECVGEENKLRSAIMPGNIYKKIWINVGDVVLCERETTGLTKDCSIVHKYTPQEVKTLKDMGEIYFDISDGVGCEFVDSVNRTIPGNTIVYNRDNNNNDNNNDNDSDNDNNSNSSDENDVSNNNNNNINNNNKTISLDDI